MKQLLDSLEKSVESATIKEHFREEQREIFKGSVVIVGYGIRAPYIDSKRRSYVK